MSIGKYELAYKLVARKKLSNERLARAFVEQVFEEITHSLEQGKEVTIVGLGKFKLQHKRSRMGRNPGTGEPHEITARTVVKFHAGKKMQSKI